jgi:diaminopropionate ammonia-lyase
MEFLVNAHWSPATPTSSRAAEDVGATLAAFHRSLPQFEPTPLVMCPGLAEEIGASAVWVKHERSRLGLPSFKVLGASWGVNCAIAAIGDTTPPHTIEGLAALAAGLPSGTRLATATDGNHGRAVARMASLLGLPCEISVPVGTTTARIDAIASEGADVRVIDASYDDVVRRVAALAESDPRRILVQDTSWAGYVAIPSAIVAGYGTLFVEAERQLALDGASSPDIAFVPAGVGSLAAAAVEHLSPGGTAVVTVEPDDADCVRRSLSYGTPTSVPGPHRSIMAGLNCGEVSAMAWPLLRTGLRGAAAVTNEETVWALRMLDAAGLPSGESGAAALAGARAAARGPDGRALW